MLLLFLLERCLRQDWLGLLSEAAAARSATSVPKALDAYAFAQKQAEQAEDKARLREVSQARLKKHVCFITFHLFLTFEM